MLGVPQGPHELQCPKMAKNEGYEHFRDNFSKKYKKTVRSLQMKGYVGVSGAVKDPWDLDLGKN